MDVDGLRLSIATVASKLEAFSRRTSHLHASSEWIQPQIQTLDRGLERIQEWLHSVDVPGIQLLYSSLQDVADTLDASVVRLLEGERPQTPVNHGSQSHNGKAPIGPSTSRRSSRTNDLQLEKQSIILKDCIALTDFASAVCYAASENSSDHEVRELAVGSRILKETLTCSDKESHALWQEQKAEAEQYISANYEVFIDTVLTVDEDFSESSTSEVTITRPASRASSTETDFTTVIARGTEQFTSPDVLHLPTAQNGTSSVSLFTGSLGQQRRQPRIEESTPVISVQKSTSRTSVNGNNDGPVLPPRPRLSASASFPRSSGSQMKRKPILRKTANGNPSMVSLSTSSSSSSAAEKAINIASGMELTAQSPTRTVDRSDNTQSRRFSEQPSLLSNRASTLYEKYQDSPPPYVPPAPAAPPPDPPLPAVAEAPLKRRETLNNSRTPYIISLVRESQTNVIRSLPKEGMNIDEVDPATGRTALMESALLRQPTIAQILVFSGSRLHLKDAGGNTALHFAAAQGDAASCQVFLDAGAQMDEWNQQGETPLQLAARGGHTEAVVCLLQNKGRVRTSDPSLAKGFFEASKSGNVSTAQAFLTAGMKPRKLKETWRPIAYAAQSGSVPMFDFMVLEKLNPKDRGPDDGWTALHHAAAHGHAPMIEKLLTAHKLSWKATTKASAETALHLATAAGHASAAQVLMLHRDANVTLVDAAGQEPLHHAVRNGDLPLATALLARGARLSAANKYGWKPLHLATAYGHLALVADFLTRGASVEDRLAAPAGFKPGRHTNEAARKGLWAEIRWPHPGARPLHLALEFGHDEVANMLVQGGAKVEESDGAGWTPLHYAAFHCRTALLRILLEKGADPQATADDGHTPLGLGFRGPALGASEEEMTAVVEMLRAAMMGRKKSKLRQLTAAFTSSPGERSKSAAERNKVWHTAELAAALYQGESGEGEGEEDEELFVTQSNSSLQESEGDGQVSLRNISKSWSNGV